MKLTEIQVRAWMRAMEDARVSFDALHKSNLFMLEKMKREMQRRCPHPDIWTHWFSTGLGWSCRLCGHEGKP